MNAHAHADAGPAADSFFADAGALHASVSALWVYPVKSCAGVALAEAELATTGLALDRAWMVVDEAGMCVTQREHPRMALVAPRIGAAKVVLRASGMPALRLGRGEAAAPARVRVWGDEIDAWDVGPVAARWFSDFLGRPGLRLARFDPGVRRPVDPAWTGGLDATVQFPDGYPLLLASAASLRELNARLAAGGHAPAQMLRFRPNVVIEGAAAQDEDRLAELRIATREGAAVVLRPVQPCARCAIPGIDPRTAESAPEVLDALQALRRNPLAGGAVTFGMNTLVASGAGARIRVGDRAIGQWRFD